jgi:hypothetical protein
LSRRTRHGLGEIQDARRIIAPPAPVFENQHLHPAATLQALIRTTGTDYSFAPGARLMTFSTPVPLKSSRGSK